MPAIATPNTLIRAHALNDRRVLALCQCLSWGFADTAYGGTALSINFAICRVYSCAHVFSETGHYLLRTLAQLQNVLRERVIGPMEEMAQAW